MSASLERRATKRRGTSAAPELSDDALLQSIAHGGSDAFTALVHRYQRRFYAVAHRMLGRDADAEDAVQLAFLHVLTRAAAYDTSWSGSTWLYPVGTRGP